jgi:tRNA A37 threonylcarbamoyladenosine biosynthesis protein TsaE
MKQVELLKKLVQNFPFQPSKDQKAALHGLSEFVLDLEPRTAFVLKGYAGTGKTTLMQSLVKSLPEFNRKVVLLAPTGRAAKVISAYTGKQAFTVHKKIYTPKNQKGQVQFVLEENKASNTIFIVDEASMIGDGNSDSKLFQGGSLLDDLVQYVYSGLNCKLMLVGDIAQLPPVGLQMSPAMEPFLLEGRFRLSLREYELREVQRQAKNSGILFNANQLRFLQDDVPYKIPKFNLNLPDVVRISESYELEEALNEAYKGKGVEGAVVICRSNKRANTYNQEIRSRIRWYDSELSVGDHLMVVKNNYFWLPKSSKAGFIANGDVVEITYIRDIKDMYGFRFARISAKLIDYPEEPELETVILLDTLTADGPALAYEDSNKLYQEVNKHYMTEKHSYRRFMKVKSDPYFNALQVKFAYAVTCHKAQGGQWDTVFLEQAWLPDGEINSDYLRWLYTAFTRAVSKIYLIGFGKEYFDSED